MIAWNGSHDRDFTQFVFARNGRFFGLEIAWDSNVALM